MSLGRDFQADGGTSSISFVVLFCGFVLMGGGWVGSKGREKLAYYISFTASDVCVCFGTCSAAAIIDCLVNI